MKLNTLLHCRRFDGFQYLQILDFHMVLIYQFFHSPSAEIFKRPFNLATKFDFIILSPYVLCILIICSTLVMEIPWSNQFNLDLYWRICSFLDCLLSIHFKLWVSKVSKNCAGHDFGSWLFALSFWTALTYSWATFCRWKETTRSNSNWNTDFNVPSSPGD